MITTKRKPLVRSAPKPPTRITLGIPFRILADGGKLPLVEGHLLIVPDDAPQPSAKPFIPGMPAPIVLRRRQMACLLRDWRNSPDTPPDARNWPTVSELMGMLLRRAMARELAETLNPSRA